VAFDEFLAGNPSGGELHLQVLGDLHREAADSDGTSGVVACVGGRCIFQPGFDEMRRIVTVDFSEHTRGELQEQGAQCPQRDKRRYDAWSVVFSHRRTNTITTSC
jgi:hypothetical protein